MVRPSTCCRISQDGGCVCAAQARCACGKEAADACNCGKNTTPITGPKCSCRMRPAGQCTCERAVTENRPVTGEACPCGSRPAGSCTCEKADAVDSAANAVYDAFETDFTGKA
ncbi:hypothetical protein VTN96DRAFT_8950 [Rasamsonia emersonii]|uniref:Copper resistance protein Crd2 n=1 Tax=Rasamsonia emersonii (strain ATCC 16479 / CBS 393.64 / IMI 116815) TaxID=1408163 RepID=A0A0F4YUQ9_RASE3|nr:Copper resistance protein Crd2 [Rasamsonia emersonii CBS 393.64]KKA22017.1 Copper resistance protein Crd2 [Rasamsonia emersonii CBS 393.64]